MANQIEVTTRRGVERAIRYAFEYAKQFGRKKVTLVAKTNVLRLPTICGCGRLRR